MTSAPGAAARLLNIGKEDGTMTNKTKQAAWLLLVLLLTGTGSQAASDADKCAAAKNKIAGKYAFCRQQAEAKAPGMCPTNGDATPIQACITAHTNDIAGALNGGTCSTPRFPASGQTTSYGPGSDGDVEAGAPLSYTDNATAPSRTITPA